MARAGLIKTTSDLTDSEAETLMSELKLYEQQHGHWLARHFLNADECHCFNINPIRRPEWNSFWGMWKSRFCRARQ